MSHIDVHFQLHVWRFLCDFDSPYIVVALGPLCGSVPFSDLA
jgi:hypothetical protein